jgi:hypothetical protein
VIPAAHSRNAPAAGRLGAEASPTHFFIFSQVDVASRSMQVRFATTSHGVCASSLTAARGVITLAGAEHCFMYVVHDNVVDTVIGRDTQTLR